MPIPIIFFGIDPVYPGYHEFMTVDFALTIFYSTNYFDYVCGIELVFELTKVHKYLGGIGIGHVNPLVNVYS